MEDLPAALLNGVGVVTLLVILFWMLAKDNIVTGPAHKREIADKDAQIERLVKAAERDAETIKVRDQQVAQLAVVGETVMKILNTVEDLARRRSR